MKSGKELLHRMRILFSLLKEHVLQSIRHLKAFSIFTLNLLNLPFFHFDLALHLSLSLLLLLLHLPQNILNSRLMSLLHLRQLLLELFLHCGVWLVNDLRNHFKRRCRYKVAISSGKYVVHFFAEASMQRPPIRQLSLLNGSSSSSGLVGQFEAA